MIKRCPECGIQTLARVNRALGQWFCIWCLTTWQDKPGPAPQQEKEKA